ncbi:inorganic phosphate cotransporter [Trichonephila inaurata madagascariensis]|uniref:Inorganic phosphate cotransporter n=1 Tax=Trichonephila inaurata madagascariensis TaxID=2747483 RepID=A0A8X6X1H6_9ARAC|nr:inorganic phosphate cotransporter [Trichonephila inaurata madagascariensis]
MPSLSGMSSVLKKAYDSTPHATRTPASGDFLSHCNGATSCLPVAMKSVGGVIASLVSNWLTKKNYIGVNKLRKGCTSIGALGFSLCMAGILLAGCDTVINILCFSLSLLSSGIALAGIMIAVGDMSPMFSGQSINFNYTITMKGK